MPTATHSRSMMRRGSAARAGYSPGCSASRTTAKRTRYSLPTRSRRSRPSIATDPAQAWLTMSDGIQAILDDPDKESSTFSHPRAGEHQLDDAIGMFILGDVLIHTWDLARATGLDETLDAAEVARMFEG